MLTLTCCQDHILTENIWFVCSETSYSGYERRCYRCGTTTNEQLKIELLSQWKLEAESRNFEVFTHFLHFWFSFLFYVTKLSRKIQPYVQCTCGGCLYEWGWLWETQKHHLRRLYCTSYTSADEEGGWWYE